ncbi:MAG: NAD(P)-dependent oxidoreductase [Christensenellales bacterium]|jgi:lactate dehydrogenase-like 2-hydroxyacid dehydrogenase
MKKVLVSHWLSDELVERCKEDLLLDYPAKEKGYYTSYELMSKIKDHEGLLVAETIVDKALIDAGRSLKVIASIGAGYNNINDVYAGEKGIYVINAPKSVTDATAELTVALILSVARCIVHFDKCLRSQKKVGAPIIFGEKLKVTSTLSGKVLGIVGMGRIGRDVARKVKGFGIRIVYSDIVRADKTTEEELGATFVSFEELLKISDYVSVHCPYTPDNHHLFDEKAFDLMKPNACFFNVARGQIMDESALVDALKKNKIKGAGLDVFEYEPDINEELFDMDNVVITPHVGSFVEEVRSNMAVEALTGISAIFRDEVPPNVVNLQYFKNERR